LCIYQIELIDHAKASPALIEIISVSALLETLLWSRHNGENRAFTRLGWMHIKSHPGSGVKEAWSARGIYSGATVYARRDWWLSLSAEGQTLSPEFLGQLRVQGGTARDVMAAPIVSVGEDTDVPEIARLLGAHRIKRVPVVRDGRVVGIVSRADLLPHWRLRNPYRPPRERRLTGRVSSVGPIASITVVGTSTPLSLTPRLSKRRVRRPRIFGRWCGSFARRGATPGSRTPGRR
jgi:hypothetical protein